MKSHSYDFQARDFGELLLPLLVPIAAFALLMHLGAWTHLFPPSRPTLDMDRTILIHQAEAAQKQSADILLMGDSSCLMNVSATDLSPQLFLGSSDGRAGLRDSQSSTLNSQSSTNSVLNLGCLSYLGLQDYALLLRRYTTAHPGSPRTVVLLMHPEALRQLGPDPVYSEFLKKTLEHSAPASLSASPNRFYQLLGVDLFKAHFLARSIPTPLRGSYRQRYGFTRDLENLLDANHGSLLDPEPQPFKGNAEYRLAPQIQTASRVFKSTVPGTTKLYVGITPVPAGFPKKSYPETHAQMLKQWSQWLGAEPLPLPAIMPDEYFSKTTHLNPNGVRLYTTLLANSLK